MAHVIAFVAPKGGIGCTSLALVMATALRKLHGPKIALIEGDLMFGDLATMVGLVPNRSILDILDKPRPWTANMVSRAVIHHPILDFDVVLAPAESHLSEKVSSKNFADFLDALDKSHDFVLVDVATNISDRELEIFERASAIYMVTAPDPVTMSATRKMLQVFNLLKSPMKKLAVLNNHPPSSACSLTSSEMKDGLGVPLLAEFPRGKSEEFSYQNLRLLEPFAPWGEAQKQICNFIREVRTALWTGKPAPGTATKQVLSSPSFSPYAAIAGKEISVPLQGAPKPTPAVLGAPPPPPPFQPSPEPRPTSAPVAQTKENDPMRQTLSERLRISRKLKTSDLPSHVVLNPGAAASAAAPKGSLASGQKPYGHKIRILVADDNEGFRTGLCRALEFEERVHVVGQAQDGQEALDMAAKLSPEMVLLDANMPRLTGLQTAVALKSAMPQVAVLMMSVQDEEELVQKALSNGVRHFFLKPFEPDEISSLIEKLFPE